MEQSMPVIGKKSWNLVRAVFYMLRKGIAKGKLMADLNIMLKRGKIADKAFQNLMFHHHYTWSISAAFNHRHSETLPVDRSPPPGEYEFSCSSSPTSIFSFPKKQHNNHHSHFWERDPRCFPLLNFDGAMLTMGSSPRFPMYDNDFGWGKPVAVRSDRANKFDGKSRRFPGERAAVVLILRLFWRRRQWRDLSRTQSSWNM